ncbi:hypothetical protein [Flavisolibacter nicotianae]|uniref:hypothetical protein n=1 Tax=Flavisolibacter nicotianae TaxID=2364882 RepID=UPI000EAB55D5|nr:hypothetical protein [Flavisolibacter nicotianae]
MKKHLLLFFLAAFFFSCNKNSSPTETAEQFITALASADLTTATALASSDTKTVLEKAQKETKNTQKPADSFQFASLAESVSGNKADVHNDIISLPLVKESDGWKVVLTETLLNEIQKRDEMQATVKAKWAALLKEYEARLQVAKEYINYKKGMGTLSPKAALLNETLNSISAPGEWTRETTAGYLQKQQALSKVIDQALEPSKAANADLSLSYFLRISNAGDRIKAAETDYQVSAEKAHSLVYVPLFAKADTVNVVSK